MDSRDSTGKQIMCRQHKGQKVVRISENLAGGVVMGETYTIKYLIDDDTLALEEVDGEWSRSEFKDAATYVAPLKGNTVSLESLANALRIIDMWNRTQPTSLMVSIEAHPAQDGGSSFFTSTADSNDVDSFVADLLKYSSGREKARILRAAAALVEQE